ncbi:uncharacterized protein [Rutidosis leptorrhynchoides]|uniref:uncharacterized protein n=1 Tax=Rutidosis leptorrhynchoides TaxID=125765 RepID=UPI003A9908DB
MASIAYSQIIPLSRLSIRSPEPVSLISFNPSSLQTFPRSPLLSTTQFNTHKNSPITNCTSVSSHTSEDEIPIELRSSAFPTVLDISQIREVLPQRYPFLLVDRIIEINPGVSAVGIKNVTINDDFFLGHFPERPIMPAVLLAEAMAQVGCFIFRQSETGGTPIKHSLGGDKMRFRKPVVAGDTLVMRTTLTKLQKRFGIAKLTGKAYVGGELVCEGEFSVVLGSSE